MKRISSIIVALCVLTFGFRSLAQEEAKVDPKPVAKSGIKITKITKKVESSKVKVEPSKAVTVVAPLESQPVETKKEVKTESSVVSVTPVTVSTVEMPWWKVVIQHVLELIFGILGILATVFVSVLLKKYGFETYTAKINDLLERGVGFAEQKSAQALKLNGTPLGSAEKLALALDYVSGEAKKLGLADKGKEWWENKVEGWLGAKKIDGGI